MSPKGVCDLIRLKLLPQEVMDYVSNDTHDSGDKASEICNTVSNQMQINPEAVYSFISALEEAGEWTCPAVNKFKKALENRKQEECIKSKQKINKPLIQKKRQKECAKSKQKINKPLIQKKRELWGMT